MFSIFCRVAGYCLGLFGVMFLAESYFQDTYLANIMLFFSFSLTFELLLKNQVVRGKKLIYVLCLIGMLVGSIVLAKQSENVQVKCQKQKQSGKI